MIGATAGRQKFAAARPYVQGDSMTEVLSLGGFLITRDEWELWGEDDRRDILTALAGTGEPAIDLEGGDTATARSN